MLFLAMTTTVFGSPIDKRLHALTTQLYAKDAAAASHKLMRVAPDAVTVQSMNPNQTRDACDRCTRDQNTALQADTFLEGNMSAAVDAPRRLPAWGVGLHASSGSLARATRPASSLAVPCVADGCVLVPLVQVLTSRSTPV